MKDIHMRRTDRELLKPEEITDVLSAGTIAQIAFIDGQESYIVTMNYGFSDDPSGLKLYFHCANQGRKIDCIRNNPQVCFTISICDPFTPAAKACGYGMKYRSVVGYGKIRIITDDTERITGLNQLMKQYTGKDSWEYDQEMLKKTTVFCLDVERISGKQRK